MSLTLRHLVFMSDFHSSIIKTGHPILVNPLKDWPRVMMVSLERQLGM